MITFIHLGRYGRLGNVLWQYAAMRGISLKTKHEFKIPDTRNAEHHGQTCLLECFNIQRNYLTQEDYNSITHSYKNTTDAQRFDIGAFNIHGNTDFLGYFQNLKYFEGYEDIIKKELRPLREYRHNSADYLKVLRRKIGNHYPIVSLHVRRGDVVSQAGSHNFDLDTLYKDYFNAAIKEIHRLLGYEVNFLVFSGGNRGPNLQSDMDWCKETFKDRDNFYYCEGQDDIHDFTIMSLCHHNINCSSTSFGWWAAYINGSPNKVVIAPRMYHWIWHLKGIPSSFVQKEFYPSNWIIM